ncbi:rac GTPase-activating protein 1-like isoform X2 [Hydractinia symbiolongicarpus]|uniref:rac GTPase-activating protein 1-like isoform X2 n=1 Tax=Hydractinia symbiolongicarpus TaxID=13093 RepID=UPI00254F5AC1|nr:rac GTPase-activating protein 1-like isoform X2 [Hydractinia symbiolongicarpus]
MKKIQRSNSIKEANAKSGNRFEKGKNQPVEMSSAVIKKYDELIRCTNVLTEGIESEFLRFVSHQDECRKKWLTAEEENHDMKKYMAKYKADKDTLEVKLKMARHQLDAEMKKRLKAEQSVDHMARQLQLIKELLLDKDSVSQLSSADKQALAQSIHQYNTTSHLQDYEGKSGQADLLNQSYTLDESSFDLPASEYDNTEDDILDYTGGSILGNGDRRKSHKRGRPSAPLLGPDETSEDTDYSKRVRVTEEVHKTIETHVQVNSTSPSKYMPPTERLDRDFSRPPVQKDRRPPTRQHLKESASSSEVTTDFEMGGYNKENASTPRRPSFTLTRHQQHTQQQHHLQVQQPKKTMTKQNTVPNLYPSLESLGSPASKTKFNTLSTPKSARKELAHNFVTKIAVRMESCTQCGKKLRFGSSVAKCKDCKVVCHPECKANVPMPCFPTKDTPGGKKKDGTIEMYVSSNADVKVPTLVSRCVEDIERRGLKELGLYRVPGMDKDVKELKEKFLRGKTPDLGKYRDVHVICGCLKDFLRTLSEPLVTYYLHESFMVAAAFNDEDDSLSAMYQCVSELPQANRDTLAAVILHLQKVSQSTETQMGITNLAKVFGPTLVGHRSSNPTHMEMLEDIKSQPIVVTRLLEMPCDYWLQFTGSATLHSKTPPYNPNYFTRTPTTPECKPVPSSLLGALDENSQSVRAKKTYNAMTPKVVSKDPKRSRHFFNSPS